MSLTSVLNLKDRHFLEIFRDRPIRRLHWLVVIGSLVITLTAWQLSLHSARERTHAQFERQVDYALDLFEQQMSRYAEILKAGVGFVAGSEQVRPEEWRIFTQQIALETDFSAIGGMGVVYRVAIADIDDFLKEQRRDRPNFTLRPEVDVKSSPNRQYIMPLTLISPERLERSAPGLDLTREPRRLDAVERAIETGSVQITAPIKPEGVEEAGFIFVAPIFKTNRPETEMLRQSEFVGAVVAAVITNNLTAGLLQSQMRQVALRVSDESEIMYNELVPENVNADPQPLMKTTRTIPFYGREWRFDFHSTKAFRLTQNNSTPAIVLICGLIIDGLLFWLFIHMARENQRAKKFGDQLARKYDTQSEALRDRCAELEAFSYLVTHDLKAPLRAVCFLTECFLEDYGDIYPGVTLHPDLTEHLNRIDKQVALAQGLIKGVMQYSSLSVEDESPEQVNMLELLHSLRITLSVKKEQLELVGEFPTFNTYRVQLTQVLLNLISNGYKYHHSQGLAVVTVSIETSRQTGYYCFSVSDNGPGIAKAHHERIFKPFTTLQPKDHSMSSGVGLAIVHKLITQQGGAIELTSDVGQGACFRFDWPCSVGVQLDASNNDADLPKAA